MTTRHARSEVATARVARASDSVGHRSGGRSRPNACARRPDRARQGRTGIPPATVPVARIVRVLVLASLVAGAGGAAHATTLIDSVRWGGNRYASVDPGREIVAADIGPVVGRVKRNVATLAMGDRPYHERNGDAEFLEAGTSLHAFGCSRPEFRLVAKSDTGWRVYEVLKPKRLRSGADLLDLEGKVRSIRLTAWDSTHGELARIEDPAVVGRWVTWILAAPPSVPPRTEEEAKPWVYESRVGLVFDLIDGTQVIRDYGRTTRSLGMDLSVPADLADAIEAILAR